MEGLLKNGGNNQDLVDGEGVREGDYDYTKRGKKEDIDNAIEIVCKEIVRIITVLIQG